MTCGALTLAFSLQAALSLAPWQVGTRLLERDALIADVRQLAEILETVHPDPYTKGGGKIAFHRRMHETLRAIPEEGMTVRELYRLLCPFLAAAADGHTELHPPDRRDDRAPGGIPLYFQTIEESLFVSAVGREEDRDLIGTVLTSVEGIPFDVLVARQRKLRGWDNEYQVLDQLDGFGSLWYREDLRQLVPEWTEPSEVTLGLRFPDESEGELTLAVPAALRSPLLEAPSAFALPSSDRCHFVHTFLDASRQTAYLLVLNMWSYRERFELDRSAGYTQTAGLARGTYRQLNGRAAPRDHDELLAGLPAATEVFGEMVAEMKAAGTRNLIIDLRSNSGGYSLMSQILCYFLYGKEDLIATRLRAPGYTITRYSEPYFAAKKNKHLEEINAGRSYPLTREDYDFQEALERPGREALAAQMEAWFQEAPTFWKEYESGERSGLYRPERVVVLCSPATYSSGYVMMLDQYRRGAVLVGTPSAQAGNCTGEGIGFELRNSGLAGNVSIKSMLTFPDDPEKGRVLRPQRLLTYEKLRSYDFDPNAEVLYALELLRGS